MFGVPNLGLDNAALLTMTMGQKNEAFARDLGENSQYLQELKRSFSLAIRNRPIRIIAIYELEDSRSVIVSSPVPLPFQNPKPAQLSKLLQKTNGRWARTGPMIRMVSRKSACDCGESAETLVTLESHTNHSGLVKFATPEDLIYQALLVQLVDIAHSVPSSYHISVQTYAELPSFVQSAKEISVPDDLESSFKGRDEILGDIHASLSANIGSQVFVLHGIGGIGKTQIALKYLSQHSQKYSKVVWVNAESEKRLQESFRTVAASLGVENTEEDLAGQVYFALAHLDEVLMIYDNLDDPSLFEVIKDGHRARWKQPFRILITTRDRTFLDLSTEDRGVEALDPDHAVDMLLNFLGVGPKPSSDMRRDASAICEAVGYLPLAIKHAASYMKVYGVPPQVYIKQLEQEPRQILEYSSAWLPYKRSVVNVCEDIMARIEKNTYATNWLYLCSFLNTSIPHDLFELAHSWWQRLLHNPQGMDTAVQHQIQWLYATPAQASWTMALMIDNIRDLHRLSLVKITRQQNGTVTSALHPLTQQWVRLRLEPQDQRRYMIMASSLIHACAEELRMSHETEQFSTAAYSTHRWLIPQAYSCIAFAENVLKQNIAEVIPVASAITMATFYMDEQKYPQALSLLEIASRKHGSHDDEINTQRAMALVLRRLRRPEEAKRVQEGIIRKLRETVDMPEWKILQVLEAAAELATIFRDLGDLDKALELQAEIVVEMQRLTGDKSLKTLHEMSCLARIHSKRCEFEKALEIEKAVLGAYRRMHSKRPEILDKMRNLAVTRYEMGDFGAAIELEEEVLKGAEGLYGPDNLVTASAMQNLATSYRRVARPGEALALYSKALGIRRQVLGEAHRATQKTARYMRLTKGIVQAAAKDADGITGLASRVDSGLGLE
ncbi:hypothetical protein GGR56DRAFT_556080 [Xylariaceae sp. FL0804]|nr:hypothetical protein GGR56DRAFT_556080 [Xylariaceae sp. FL0804]